MNLTSQFLTMLILALPVACIAWTVTHEEVAREFHDTCRKKSEASRNLAGQKFFYLFTCEYCLSHYVTIAMLILTRFKILFPDWRGYLIAGFSLVAIANVYMSLFARIRLGVKRERVELDKAEE